MTEVVAWRQYHTLLHPFDEPAIGQLSFPVRAFHHDAFECMFQGDLAPVLLAQESADYRAALLPGRMAGDVVGDGEEDEGMKLDMQS